MRKRAGVICFLLLLLAATGVPIDFRLPGDYLHDKIFNQPVSQRQVR